MKLVPCLGNSCYYFASATALYLSARLFAPNFLPNISSIYKNWLLDSQCQELYASLPSPKPKKYCLETVQSIKGNSNLTLSKIIFLSDNHRSLLANFNRQYFLNYASKPGDYYVVEGIRYDQHTSQNITLLQEAVTNFGIYFFKHIKNPHLFVNGCEHPALMERSIECLEHLKSKLDQTSETSFLNKKLLERKLVKAAIPCVIEHRNAFLSKVIHDILPSLALDQKLYISIGYSHLSNKFLNQFGNNYTAMHFRDSDQTVA